MNYTGVVVAAQLAAALGSASWADELSVMGARLGLDTLSTVQARLGRAEIHRAGRADSAPSEVCYVETLTPDPVVVRFESSSMAVAPGAVTAVIVERASSVEVRGCTPTAARLPGPLPHGVELGMSRAEFARVVKGEAAADATVRSSVVRAYPANPRYDETTMVVGEFAGARLRKVTFARIVSD